MSPKNENNRTHQESTDNQQSQSENEVGDHPDKQKSIATKEEPIKDTSQLVKQLIGEEGVSDDNIEDSREVDKVHLAESLSQTTSDSKIIKQCDLDNQAERTENNGINGHQWYDTNVGEKSFCIPAEVLRENGLDSDGTPLLEIEKVTPEEVRSALMLIYDEQMSGYGGKPRRKPERVPRIIDAFANHEEQSVFVEEITSSFASVKNPRKSVASTISELNKLLVEHDTGIEIASVTFTAYYFKKVSSTE